MGNSALLRKCFHFMYSFCDASDCSLSVRTADSVFRLSTIKK